jgi:hypothetical protein
VDELSKSNVMSHNKGELYRRKEAQREHEAKRPVSEKMAAVVRLRDFEQKLENTRRANRAKRAAKQITIHIKTR